MLHAQSHECSLLCAIFLLAGDLSRTAAAVGQQLGLPPQHTHAEHLPADKLTWVDQYKKQGPSAATTATSVGVLSSLDAVSVPVSSAWCTMCPTATCCVNKTQGSCILAHVGEFLVLVHLALVCTEPYLMRFPFAIVWTCSSLHVTCILGVVYLHDCELLALAMRCASVLEGM